MDVKISILALTEPACCLITTRSLAMTVVSCSISNQVQW